MSVIDRKPEDKIVITFGEWCDLTKANEELKALLAVNIRNTEIYKEAMLKLKERINAEGITDYEIMGQG